MTGAAKKTGLRLLLLIAVLALANLIYTHTFWKKDVESADGQILTELLNAQDSADVVFMGESSNFTCAPNDSCKKSISQLVGDYFPSLKFRAIQKGAIHARTYLELIKHIEENKKLKTLIITMNLRSFDADWIHSKLETSLLRTDIMFKQYPPLLNRFLLSLNAYSKKTEKQRQEDAIRQREREELVFPTGFKYKTAAEWDAGLANGSYLNADGSWNMPKIELACHYVKSYAFQLNEHTNPRIKDFDGIVSACRKKNIHLVFSLLAENVQYADSLAGRELVFLMRQNRDYLMKRYNRDNVTVVDNLETVNGKDFIDQNWTTEHYNERGRIYIAKNIAEKIKKLFPGEYVFHNISSRFGNPSAGIYLPSEKATEIEKIKSRMTASAEWMEHLKNKARERNISLEQMMQIDADYVYETEIKPKEKK